MLFGTVNIAKQLYSEGYVALTTNKVSLLQHSPTTDRHLAKLVEKVNRMQRKLFRTG